MHTTTLSHYSLILLPLPRFIHTIRIKTKPVLSPKTETSTSRTKFNSLTPSNRETLVGNTIPLSRYIGHQLDKEADTNIYIYETIFKIFWRERERIANNTAGFLETKAVEIACIQKSLSSMAGHRGEWTPFWWRRHIDSTAQRTMLTPKHSETGIISVYIHEQYVYRERCAEGWWKCKCRAFPAEDPGTIFTEPKGGHTFPARSTSEYIL